MEHYKCLKKPNHWRIVLFLEKQRMNLTIAEEEQMMAHKIRDRFTVPELSRELNMAQSHMRGYLKELEDLGIINVIKIRGRLEVLL